MLKQLVKKQMAEIFRSYLYDAKKSQKRAKGTVILYFALFVFLMVGVLGGMFTFVAMMLCDAMAAVGMGWLYFTLMGLVAIFMGAFGSVFNTYSSLYLAKDNDLLLSLPIPLRVIISSRLVTVYLMGLMYSAVVIVPAVIVYWVQVAHSAAAIVGGLLTVAIVSLIVLLLSCLLGWVVAKISLKLKHKSITTVLVSLLGIGLYYFIYFKAQTVISDLVANAVVYGVKIKGAAYPLYLFGRMAEGDWTAMALVSAAVVLLTALTWLLLSRSFLRLATSGGSAGKARYREKKARVRSLPAALLGKECRRFVSSPNYMLNCGMGVLMIPAAGVLLLLKGGEWMAPLKAVLPGADSVLAALAISVACLLASMNDMAAPSVSLEGKSLWVLQSLPVSAWEVLKAKLKMQLVFTGIPMLVFLACALPVLGLSPVLSLLTAAGSLLSRTATGPVRADHGPENAQPALDQRNRPGQAGRQRSVCPAGWLGLRPSSGRSGHGAGPESASRSDPRRFLSADGSAVRTVVCMAEKSGREGICRAVSASIKHGPQGFFPQPVFLYVLVWFISPVPASGRSPACCCRDRRPSKRPDRSGNPARGPLCPAASAGARRSGSCA